MGAFKHGDRVSVTSKGHGKITVRSGVIWNVYAPGQVPRAGLFRYKPGKPRRHESYLVFTTIDPKGLKKSADDFDNHTDRFLWPRVGNIKMVRRAPVKK